MRSENQGMIIDKILRELGFSELEGSENLGRMLSGLEEQELAQLNKLLTDLPDVSERRKKIFAFAESILLMRPVTLEKNKIASELDKELAVEEKKLIAEIKASKSHVIT